MMPAVEDMGLKWLYQVSQSHIHLRGQVNKYQFSYN